MKNIILLTLESMYSYFYFKFCIYTLGIPKILAKSKNFNLDLTRDENINKKELEYFIFNNIEGSASYYIIVSHENELLTSFGFSLAKDLTYQPEDIKIVNQVSLHIMGQVNEIFFIYGYGVGDNIKQLTISIFKY